MYNWDGEEYQVFGKISHEEVNAEMEMLFQDLHDICDGVNSKIRKKYKQYPHIMWDAYSIDEARIEIQEIAYRIEKLSDVLFEEESKK